MEYGAIDLHKQESQIRIVKEDGEIGDYRIATTRGLCLSSGGKVQSRQHPA
jgi:hypothetical protein